MSDLICRKTMRACLTPGMCSPFGGCRETESSARIDPMQDPLRPTFAKLGPADEHPAESVLRKLACWLGVGGYNAPTVDAEVFHRKIVDGIEYLVRERAAPSAPRDAVSQFACGVDAAARLVEQRRADYDAEHGSTDPETGTREYPGTGDEYVCELAEIAEAIRGLAPPPAAPEPSEAARMYIDGEWNSYRGDLLSLALVGEDGCEWYEVLEFDGKPDPWVAANVMPKLRKAPVSLELMQGSLQRFLDRYPAGVHIVADWPEDIERFCRVLVTGPGQRLGTPPLTMEVVRIEPVSADPHNALADARALRDALRAAAAARNTNPA